VAEISAASSEQAQGIGQINTAVTGLDKVTQQNAANAEESASAAEDRIFKASQEDRAQPGDRAMGGLRAGVIPGLRV